MPLLCDVMGVSTSWMLFFLFQVLCIEPVFHPVAQCTAGTALPARCNVSNERALNNKLSDKQELLLYPVCLPFSAIELDVDSALHTTQ